VEWHPDSDFTEQAKAMNRQLFEDLDHRLFSGIEVMREIARRRGREAALMPIVFTSAIGLVEPTEGNRLKGEINGYGISQTPQVFIDCQAMDTAAGLQVNWDVRKQVFPGGLIDDMFDTFRTLMNSLARSDQPWDQPMPLPLPAWQRADRQQANATRARLPEQLLQQPFLDQAAATPNLPAVIDSEGEISYRLLARRATAVANALCIMGCKPQDRVAVVMDKCAHQVTAVLGALLAGAVYVPIDTLQPQLRRIAMLEQTGIGIVLTCAGVQSEWPEGIRIIEVDKLEPEAHVKLDTAIADPGLPAYIIFTSGSTGQPKGVVVSHRAALNTILDINRRFNVGQGDRVLGLAQLGFDLSVYDIFGLLAVGGALVYPSVNRQADPSHWAELMAEHRVTLWNSVPALMQMLIIYLESEHRADLGALRLALLSGDWVPLSLPDELIERLPSVQLVSLGGATEAAIWSIFHPYRNLQPNWNSIPYGRPLANQGFRVLDAAMRDCPVWVPGELYITDDGLAEGYFADDETTQEKFFSHPRDGQRLYRTGELRLALAQ
jgi:pyochelin synthetase